MADINCESIRVAAMALADGETPPLRPEEIETHLLICDRCREEVEQMRATNQLLSSQKRLIPEANLWPLVNERIQASAPSAPLFGWRVLLVFAIPLFGYRILLLILQASPSLWSKLVPVILVIAVFGYLRVNPFKINSELTLKGETSS
ncbi:MAG: anti-sigma factor family protein [Pyrinomonadaceae bacterium]